jgi:MFS family permease
LLSDLRHKIAAVSAVAPRAYWYVWWGTLINRLGGFVVPLLTIYITTIRRQSVVDAGTVVAVFGAGNVLASIIGGQMSDRLGRRVTMLVSMFGGAAAMAGLGLARDLTEITAMTFVVGFLSELYRPAVLAFVSDVVPQSHRVHAFGLLYWATNLGFACAAAIGGIVADLDFRILFVADAITMAIYGVIVAVAVPETRPAAVIREKVVHVRPWRDREFVIFVWINLMLVLLPMQLGSTLPIHMASQGFSSSTYGLVMAMNGLMIIVVQPMMLSWTARHDAQRILIAAALLYGVGLVAHGLAPIALAHAAAVVIWSMGEILESPTRSAVVAAMAPASARGRYQGMFVMTWGVGQMVGPKVGTYIWQDAGPAVLWASCAGLAALVAFTLWITAASRRARMERAVREPS